MYTRYSRIIGRYFSSFFQYLKILHRVPYVYNRTLEKSLNLAKVWGKLRNFFFRLPLLEPKMFIVYIKNILCQKNAKIVMRNWQNPKKTVFELCQKETLKILMAFTQIVIGRIHLSLMDGPSIKCVIIKTFLFFI